MKFKMGICAKCGNYRMIVNKRYGTCVACNRIRLDGQKSTGKVIHHAKAIKRFSTVKTEQKKAQAEADKAFYLDLWNRREHRCKYCDEPLYGLPKNYFFHHVFTKKKFPSLRYRHANVVLVCLSCHSIVETGKFTDIMKQVILDTGKWCIEHGLLIEIGESNVQSPHKWVIESENSKT